MLMHQQVLFLKETYDWVEEYLLCQSSESLLMAKMYFAEEFYYDIKIF